MEFAHLDALLLNLAGVSDAVVNTATFGHRQALQRVEGRYDVTPVALDIALQSAV